MGPTFREVDAHCESADLVAFLCGHDWPFHGVRRPTAEQVRAMPFSPPATRSFWIDVGGEHVGLLRLQDLDDIGDGHPVFDIRIATERRGRGLGRKAVDWLVAMLFTQYPAAHRLEATTRIDNLAMRRVLDACGFRLEGRLRETWPVEGGGRMDTALYGILRRDVLRDGA